MKNEDIIFLTQLNSKLEEDGQRIAEYQTKITRCENEKAVIDDEISFLKQQQACVIDTYKMVLRKRARMLEALTIKEVTG